MAVITSAVVVAGGAIAGAVIKSKASKDAAKASARGQQAALAASQQGATSAIGDINRLFGTAAEARQGGFTQALDFLSGAPAQQIAPFQQGNVLAQEQLARGLPQFQQAILGQPTDLSGFQARQIGQPSDFNINIPTTDQLGPIQPPPGSGQPVQGQTIGGGQTPGFRFPDQFGPGINFDLRKFGTGRF